MFRLSFCLDEVTLQQLASGRVAEPECSELEAHVRACPRCQAAYDAQFELIIESLRTPPPLETDVDRQLIEELIERLKLLGRKTE